MTFLINSNPELIEVINDSEETDLSIDDVLMPQDDVTTYNTSTNLGVFGFLRDNPEPEFFDAVGLRAMVDERAGLKIYAEQYDFETQQSVPYAYGDNATNEMYMNENGQWRDIEGEAEPEEIMYGTYSNVEPILRDDLSDLIEVRETDDYYVLYYLGEDKGIFDSLGELFSVEFTNANMDEMTTGVFGIINKDTTEFEHLSYITHAPGENPEEFLQIDVALDFLDYGEHDIGLPRPEGLELE